MVAQSNESSTVTNKNIDILTINTILGCAYTIHDPSRKSGCFFPVNHGHVMSWLAGWHEQSDDVSAPPASVTLLVPRHCSVHDQYNQNQKCSAEIKLDIRKHSIVA